MKRIKQLKLEVFVPSYVLKDAPQTLVFTLDSQPLRSVSFHKAGTADIALEKLDACDGKPHMLAIRASNTHDVSRTSGFPGILHSIAIAGIEVQLCDGTAYKPERKYWSISGINGWRGLIASD